MLLSEMLMKFLASAELERADDAFGCKVAARLTFLLNLVPLSLMHNVKQAWSKSLQIQIVQFICCDHTHAPCCRHLRLQRAHEVGQAAWFPLGINELLRTSSKLLASPVNVVLKHAPCGKSCCAKTTCR